MGLKSKLLVGAALIGSTYYFTRPEPEKIIETEHLEFECKYSTQPKKGYVPPSDLEFLAIYSDNGDYVGILHKKTGKTYWIEEDDNTLFINSFSDLVGRAVNDVVETVGPYVMPEPLEEKVAPESESVKE